MRVLAGPSVDCGSNSTGVLYAVDPTGCVASWSLELGWAERHFGDPVGTTKSNLFEYETGSHWNEGRA
jgi:hypothetical protein